MKKLIFLVLYNIIAVASFAQDDHQWKVGDRVQVKSYSMDKWENATIGEVRGTGAYKARLDVPGKYADDYPLVYQQQVRAIDAKPTGTYKVGNRVDLLYSDGRPHARASVGAILPDGRYKVIPDGCGTNFNEIVGWDQLRPAPFIATTHPDISSLIGKWALFTPSYPNTVIRGNDVYREYGMGGKAPPLEILANGTFVWYMEYKKPPVRGKWVQDAKVEGLTTGTGKYNGIIFSDGQYYYKVYRDKPNHIICEKLCFGTIDMGTKIN